MSGQSARCFGGHSHVFSCKASFPPIRATAMTISGRG
jgi:hypothetical protein